MNDNDHNDPDKQKWPIEDLIMDDLISISDNQNDENDFINKKTRRTGKTDIESNIFNIQSTRMSKIKRESKLSQIFNLYFETLQKKGCIDNNTFIKSIEGDKRRVVGQITSVLEYFNIVKRDKNIVTLCSSSTLNPPIKIKFLEEEISKLEIEIQNLKEQLHEIQIKKDKE